MILIEVYGIPPSVLALTSTEQGFQSCKNNLCTKLQEAVTRFAVLGLSRSEVLVTIDEQGYHPTNETGVERVFMVVSGNVKKPIAANKVKSNLETSLVNKVEKLFSPTTQIECKVIPFDTEPDSYCSSWSRRR